ncbi:MAG: ExbD/TolR family protein [Sphingomonadaceae bacterium]
MARSARIARDDLPICEINTTPMIDVMLVLLIMLMLTLPRPTHKVAIDLPSANGKAAVPPPVHRLSISETGSYSWDGAPLTAAALPTTLRAFAADPRAPILHLETNQNTTYDRFDHTLALVKRAGITKIGFVGNPTGF